MKKDYFFGQPMKKVGPFKFDQGVADVFDDMVSRSVPYYHEIHHLITDILNYTFKQGDTVYDLGCSTGSTIKILSNFLKNQKVHFIGVDNSYAMLNKAEDKLKDIEHTYELIENDIAEMDFNECGMVIMNYTLQFLGPRDREHIINKIFKSLRPGGVFILSEKIESQSSEIEKLTTDLYYDFKRRNGYSELEISQKREALEEVLIPWTPGKHLELLKSSGFEKSEMIFRWYNFSCFIGLK